MARIVFECAASLVRKLAEVDFEGVRRGAQHVDVCPGAKYSRLQTRNHHGANLRMLEAQPLNRVGEFYVDAQIVGIEFKFVTLVESVVLGDVHRKRRYSAVDIELPVMILV